MLPAVTRLFVLPGRSATSEASWRSITRIIEVAAYGQEMRGRF